MKIVNVILICLLALVVIALTRSKDDVFVSQDLRQNSALAEREITTAIIETERVDMSKQFVDSCRKFIGTPHQYGGLSDSGIDCSGLLYVNFASVGLSIPRNSALQSEYFESVDFIEAQLGDLLFFGSSEQAINHAGVITEVDSLNNIRFIHTSSSQGVIEENLKSDYWTRKLIKIGRPDYESAGITG
ncbi:MAG: cell wall-associated NlpC family hydrolase [Spirosomataceae bacterium]|jgi:cell wall-associated NlpC family hydrolase